MVTFGVTCTKFSDANGVARPKIQDGQQDLFFRCSQVEGGEISWASFCHKRPSPMQSMGLQRVACQWRMPCVQWPEPPFDVTESQIPDLFEVSGGFIGFLMPWFIWPLGGFPHCERQVS